jgi:hypothetical protein
MNNINMSTDSTYGSITYPTISNINNKIRYCPYCGKEFPENIIDVRYCLIVVMQF